ncbi:MutS-related protein [Dawidia soli]|uniref:DNA mismatch repair proteins mutS family domain-containing protein n=1 Tax=Dawidia soli TaxID=2782352 RepID=A0AAP2GG15_9BACT|nr:MutS family DNA mismatch repair protein [Dawidia soli]MBT1690049.1 hypothetical protein [Dawidia soli]
MTSADLDTFYARRHAAFAAALATLRKKINNVSNIRLATAVLFLIVLYIGLAKEDLYLYGALALLAAFIALVKYHAQLFDQRVHLENLVRLNEGERKSLAGDHSAFPSGIEFTDPHHPYTHDLDVFGEGSLFQAVNRCNTLSGKKKFAYRLAHPLSSARDIEAYQQAVQALAGATDFRQHFQAAGMSADEKAGDREQLEAWLKQPAFLYGKVVYRYGLVIMPVVTVLLVIASFFLAQAKPWAILFALSQWAFLGFHIRKINAFHDYISRKKNILRKYARLLHEMQRERFDAPLLQQLTRQAHEADIHVRTLAARVSALDARLNAMTSLVMNSLFLYDLRCVYNLEQWKAQHADQLIPWLEAIREMEVLCSLGTFAFNHPAFRYATIQEKLAIEVMALGHPLISAHERVDNDLAVGAKQSVLVITGANMAGKSTFLRTIGINLVLALNGAPVCAAEFRCPVIGLRTGMRTADSLKDHQSYFYAELNRLKTIMDELRQDRPLLILLDEILKGTNSTDKQAGSIALVKQLLPHPCLALIATHDLALGELEQEYPEQVKSYCFEATIENDQLSFDYKLKPGLAQKMNATFLMKKMGIIPN